MFSGVMASRTSGEGGGNGGCGLGAACVVVSSGVRRSFGAVASVAKRELNGIGGKEPIVAWRVRLPRDGGR